MRVYILLFTALTAGALSLSAQQELMLSGMSQTWSMNQVNPSFFPTSKRIMIGLPAFGIDAAHSGEITYRDFFKKENNKTVINFDNAIAKLEPENEVNYQQRIETASIGLRLPGKGKTVLQAGHAIRLSSASTYPRDMVRLLWEGNAPFIGQTISVAPTSTTFDWHELSLGISRDFGKKLRIGAKLKYLAGISAFVTDPNANTATVYTDPDIYQLRVTTNYGFHALGTISAIDTSGFGFKVFTENVGNQFNTQNTGMAFDLGVTLHLTPDIDIYASVLDLGGKITWKEGQYHKSQGVFDYEGVNILGSGLINGSDSLDFSSQLDTLNDIFQFERSDSEFSNSLPTRFYVSTVIRLNKRWNVGASLYHEQQEITTNTAFGISLHWKPIKLLQLGVMYSGNSRKLTNLGFQATLTPGPVQLFFASDNLLNAFAPYNASLVNFKAGLALAL